MAPLVQNSLWQYRIEEEGYRQLNSQWASVKDASYRVELANAQQGLSDTIKQVIGFYKKDAYGNIDLSTGAPVVDANFVTTYLGGVTPAANADISVLLGGTQTGSNLENWVGVLTTYVDRAQAERKDVPDNLKQAISGLESSLIEYLSAQAYIANRDTTSGLITTQANDTRAAETIRLKNIAKVLQFYQNINGAMSGFSGTSPIGAYSAFVTELSKTQNRQLLTLFNGANGDVQVNDSLTELFALSDQLKTVREQLYATQIQQQFLDARKSAYAQNKVLSVSEFIAGVNVLDTSSLKSSLNSITADSDFEKNLAISLAGSTQSEIYTTKLWDILSAFSPLAGPGQATIAEIITLKTTLLNALQSDSFANQVKTDLNSLSARDLYSATGGISPGASASIDAFLAEQATRADTFSTNLSTYINSLPGATTTASAITLIATWMQNATNVSAMQQDFAAEVNYFMQGLDGTMAFAAFKTSAAAFIGQFANPSTSEQNQLKALTEQNELANALNNYYYSANFNPNSYPVELRKFVALKGYYQPFDTAYKEFLRLKNSNIQDEQNKAVLNLSGAPQEMQRYFYLNDFYSYMDGAGAAGGAAGLTAYFNASGGGKDAAQYVADYLQSRKINSQIIGSSLANEFTASFCIQHMKKMVFLHQVAMLM